MEITGATSINGEIKISGDKSISHRSAIISSLIKTPVKIKNFLFSRDCINTLDIIEKLGVRVEKIDGVTIIHGRGIDAFEEPSDILYVGNSGTTIRLMSGLLSSTDFMSVLTGDSSINSRPMDRIISPLKEMGAKIYGREKNTRAPLVIFGNRLKGKNFELKISSAQVKSALLLAGLSAEGPTEITQPGISRDHTERMLEYFGAKIEYDGRHTRLIPGAQLNCNNIFIPGDLSSAAYFIVAALIMKKSEIIIKDVGTNPTRTYFIEVLKEMGGKIDIINKRTINNEPIADIVVASSKMQNIEIDSTRIPNLIDEIPILSVAAVFSKGRFKISGAEELRYKESDRIRALCSQFQRLGVHINENKDGFDLVGDFNYRTGPGTVDSLNDHRIAMSLAVLALRSTGKVKILNSECIETSFPGFKYELKKSLS